MFIICTPTKCHVSCSSGKSVIINKLKTKEDVRTKAVFPFRILQILPPKRFNTSRDLLQHLTSDLKINVTMIVSTPQLRSPVMPLSLFVGN